ncbi:TOBE domain-containing protein [Clostridium magnum]|uniref:Molybdenum-pterin-binding protein 2 n=1 Tax=Clostridium magnum DSM 2767 TaxID=1121326 RepID=A0A162S5U4_9CLOT|nr:TOBE domain-containing protein [Clostridium magnum]KZL90814.1 molybdenum-pterin-binding protein 2 [Clostridium magnum DSM 2767]SHI11785.1 molybdate transport system regulatory protein [Clostridium magnum DSM 2767]
MKISARNQFIGKIIEVKEGAVNAIVILEIAGGNKVSSTISLNAVKDLEIVVGRTATAVIKSTSVMLASSNLKISARNQLTGKVIEIKEGAVNNIVIVEIAGGNKVSATISVSAVKELEIAVGSEVTAIIKSTSVMLATE